MSPIADNQQHFTYQLQYRKCGKPTCSTCKAGQGHGPYWYAYWNDGKTRGRYIGKTLPDSIKLTPLQQRRKQEAGA